MMKCEINDFLKEKLAWWSLKMQLSDFFMGKNLHALEWKDY